MPDKADGEPGDVRSHRPGLPIGNRGQTQRAMSLLILLIFALVAGVAICSIPHGDRSLDFAAPVKKATAVADQAPGPS